MKALTAKFAREVTDPGRYYDGDAGLFLMVADGRRGPRKSYIQRVTIRGRRRDIGLGSTKWLSLTEARAMAQANRKVARLGGDPLAAKRAAVPTFREAFESVLAVHRASWKDGGKSEKQWRSTLEAYAMKALGERTVDAITPSDVLAVVAPIWIPKHPTAKVVKQRISTVMKWAIAEGHRPDDPTMAIAAALPKNGAGHQHHRALPYNAVSGALAAVQRSSALWSTKAAFEFLTLTAGRSGEVRGARWDEIDMGAATWTVPASRMKAKREHRVPLSPRALEILAVARQHTDGSGLVFPSVTGRQLSDEALSKMVKQLGIVGTPHGMRSSFRQWAAERTNIPREVAEEALAHVNANKVEAAYQRSDLFERRRDMMSAWAAYLAAERGVVVELRA